MYELKMGMVILNMSMDKMLMGMADLNMGMDKTPIPTNLMKMHLPNQIIKDS